MASDGRSEIVEFYAGKTVFLTGFTGFLGKLTVEKLIRVCRVKKVFVLLRGKKGKGPQERVKELLELPVFDKLRETVPDHESRIVVVSGDCGLLELGLSDEDKRTVLEETEVCFHGAALLNMQANIKEATMVNVRGTREYIKLAKQMPKLLSLTYTSTAFSQCPLEHVYEKFYDCGVDPHSLIEQMDAIEGSVAESMTPRLSTPNCSIEKCFVAVDRRKWRFSNLSLCGALRFRKLPLPTIDNGKTLFNTAYRSGLSGKKTMLGEVPNTYIYTKRVTENLIRVDCEGMPVNICRPSSVISCFKEPIPGWIDNVYGPTGLLIGIALGIIRMVAFDPGLISDLVPADFVVNALLACSYETAKRKRDEIKIYTFSSGMHNPIRISELQKITMVQGKHSAHQIWHHFLLMSTNKYALTVGMFLLHTIPGYLMDGVCLLLGKERRFIRIYEKINKMLWTMRFFYLNRFRFDMRNTYDLWYSLSMADRRLFDFDIANMDWNEFFKSYLLGCRRYLLKDPDETIPMAERKAFIFKWLHYAIVTVLCYYLLKLFHWLLDQVFA